MEKFDGLNMSLGSLPRLSSAKSRSISAENPSGGKGMGGRATEGIRLLSDSMRTQLDEWYAEHGGQQTLDCNRMPGSSVL